MFAQWLVDKFTLQALSAGEGVCDVAGGRGDLAFELFNVRAIKTTLIDPREPKLRPVQRRRLRQPRLKGASAAAEEGYGIGDLEAPHATGAKADAGVHSVAAASPHSPSHSHSHSHSHSPAAAPPSSGNAAVATRSARNPYDKEAHVMCPHIQAEFGTELVNQRRAFFERVSLFVGLHPDQATEPIVDMALALGKPFAVVPCCVFPSDNPHRKLADGTQVVTYAHFVAYLHAKHPDIEVEFLPLQGANQVVFYRGPGAKPSAATC